MIFTEARLPGAYLVGLEQIEDERGFFARTAAEDEFARIGVDGRFVQWSISYNRLAGTLRGMHWQVEPHGETKLVRCVHGAIYDVIVDIRRESSGFGSWLGVDLDAKSRRALLIPPGFAHGFQTRTDDAEVLYGITPAYVAEAARGFRWDDPAVGVEWPAAEHRVISERDRALPLLSDAA